MARIDEIAIEERATGIDLRNGLELDMRDGVVRIEETDGDGENVRRVARREDVLERTDLPANHPLYGRRIVRVVPSGMPDCEIGEDGRLVPALRSADVEAEPIEDEVIRGT